MIKNILRDSGTSILSGSVVHSLGGLVSTVTGGLGVTAIYKKVKDRWAKKQEAGCTTIKFKHFTTGPDGTFCICGDKHKFTGHLVLLTTPGDELGHLPTGHYHKQAMVVCLAPQCMDNNVQNPEELCLLPAHASSI
ncbi:hypothetical protein 3 [Wenzhou tapeworm virus 1]|uniref:Uncharacterized protein n=1 Tax=Wenzhou tapeworm virus 1 TaxID=1923661 RepID=A0A1L3KN05_9MONO|nr:hypothetical protein 3 [Wenzhou tapeworm virus 1]APG78768.1 hypothetical protein 3 [Wenzhou tapeworm virus 1]